MMLLGRDLHSFCGPIDSWETVNRLRRRKLPYEYWKTLGCEVTRPIVVVAYWKPIHHLPSYTEPALELRWKKSRQPRSDSHNHTLCLIASKLSTNSCYPAFLNVQNLLVVA